MLSFKNTWSKISTLGIEPGQPHALSSSIRLANQAAFVCVILPGLYLLIEVFFIPPKSPDVNFFSFYGMQVGQITLFASVLLLNFLKRDLIARIIFCVVLPFTLLPNAYALNQPLRAEFYMYGFAASTFLFFSQRRLISVLFLIPIIVYYLMIFNLEKHFPDVYRLDFGVVLRIGLSFFYIFLAMSLLRTETNRYASELERLNLTKNKIFSIVSHDLRGPIGSLHVMLQMMQNSQITKEEFQELVPSLLNSVKYVRSTLDNLLQWSYTQSTGLKAVPQLFVFRELADEAFQLIKFNAEEKGVSIQLKGNLEMNAFADRTMTRSILINLLSNAIKFTSSGGIVSLSAESYDSVVRVSIEDTGKGMTPDMIESLLKSSGHSSTPGTNNERGTGLGLLLCKEFVHKNGGSISISSELGVGSKFSFTLPSTSIN